MFEEVMSDAVQQYIQDRSMGYGTNKTSNYVSLGSPTRKGRQECGTFHQMALVERTLTLTT